MRVTQTFSITVEDADIVQPPELPRSQVNTAFDPAFNRPPDYLVTSNLQAALDEATQGSLLELNVDTAFAEKTIEVMR